MTTVQFVAVPKVLTLNLILSPLLTVPSEPVVEFSYAPDGKVTEPIVVDENKPDTIDFSIITDEVVVSDVCARIDNLLTFQFIDDEPSTGLNGIGTSAASTPVAVGV